MSSTVGSRSTSVRARTDRRRAQEPGGRFSMTKVKRIVERLCHTPLRVASSHPL
jgi:hypothetical protein